VNRTAPPIAGAVPLLTLGSAKKSGPPRSTRSPAARFSLRRNPAAGVAVLVDGNRGGLSCSASGTGIASTAPPSLQRAGSAQADREHVTGTSMRPALARQSNPASSRAAAPPAAVSLPVSDRSGRAGLLSLAAGMAPVVRCRACTTTDKAGSVPMQVCRQPLARDYDRSVLDRRIRSSAAAATRLDPGDPDVADALARSGAVSEAKAIATVMLTFRAERVTWLEARNTRGAGDAGGAVREPRSVA
jgi:hypothetical protein